MKVNGLHGDVRVKGVLVEHNIAAGEMRNVEVIREGRVLQVFNHVPFARNVFFNCTFSASSRPRIPAQYADRVSSIKRLGLLFSKRYFQAWEREPSVVGTTENMFGTF